MKRLVSILLSLGVASGAQAENLYVFGDSFSDSGNFYVENGGFFPDPADYWNGRASTGPVWAERLGYSMGRAPGGRVLLAPGGGFSGADRGYNFAHHGQTVRKRSDRTRSQYLGSNIADFRRFVSNGSLSISAQDRFVIWSGLNDYYAYSETNTGFITRMIGLRGDQLIESGARNVYLLGLPNLADTPLGYNRGDRGQLDIWTRLHNRRLEAQAVSLDGTNGASVTYIDMDALFSDVQTNPGAYGFTIVRPGAGTSGYCTGDGFGLSTCPRGYAYYDVIHPSKWFHAYISQYVSAQMNGSAAGLAYTNYASAKSGHLSGLQMAALRGDLSTTPGFSTRQTADATYFQMAQQPVADQDDLLGSGQEQEGFFLSGGHYNLSPNVQFSALMSHGAPDTLDRFQPGQVSDSAGWASELSWQVRDLDLSLQSHGNRQALSAARATGFARDPVIIGTYRQTEHFSLLEASKSFNLGAIDLRVEAAGGYGAVKTSAVRETAATRLVTLDVGGRTADGALSRVSVSAQSSLGPLDISARLVQAQSQDGISAFSLSGLPDLAWQTDQRVERLQAARFRVFATVWQNGQFDLELDAAQADGEQISALTFRVRQSF